MPIRWYVAYSLSYRQVEELLKERGIHVDHSSVQRWVVKYSPQLEVSFRKREPMLGFKTFTSATVTIEGIELHHMLQKCQMFVAKDMPVWEQFFSLAD